MTLRNSQLTGRMRLAHLRENHEAKAEEMAEERQRFDRLNHDDAKPRAVSAFNLFQTPEPLAAQLAAMFKRFGRVLEPSAGLGRLYRAVRAVDADCHVTLVEQAAECCGELYRMTLADENLKLIQGDFLTKTPEALGLFDAVIMNPPFKMGTDVKHIEHARRFLAPGGRLVGLCADGPKQRAKLMPIASQWIELPPKSFASEGTGVNAAIVVFDA